MRICILFSIINSKLEKNVEKAVQYLCANITHKDIPIKSFAAIALGKILENKVASDLVWPQIKEMLIIYMNLINEHGHESLINSLQGIFEIFSNDLKPYVKDILGGLCQVTMRIMEK